MCTLWVIAGMNTCPIIEFTILVIIKHANFGWLVLLTDSFCVVDSRFGQSQFKFSLTFHTNINHEGYSMKS